MFDSPLPETIKAKTAHKNVQNHSKAGRIEATLYVWNGSDRFKILKDTDRLIYKVAFQVFSFFGLIKTQDSGYFKNLLENSHSIFQQSPPVKAFRATLLVNKEQEIVSLNQTIEKFKSMNTDLAARISEATRLKNENTNLQGQVSSLTEELLAAKTRITENNALLTQNDFKITNLNKELEEKNNQCEDLSNKISTIHANAKDLKALNQINLNNLKNSYEQEINVLKDSHKQEINELTTNIYNLKAENNSHNEKIENLNDEITRIENEKEELNTNIGKLRYNIMTLENNNSILKKSLSEKETDLDLINQVIVRSPSKNGNSLNMDNQNPSKENS